MSTNQNNGSGSDWTSWVLIVFLFAVGLWPIALIVLFSKLFAPDQGQRRRPTNVIPPLQTKSSTQRMATAQTVNWSQVRAAQGNRPASNAVHKVTKSPRMKSSTARLLEIFGVLLAVVGVISVGANPGMWTLLRDLAMVAGGMGMVGSGILMQRAMARYARYLAVIGDYEAMSFSEIARKLGYSEKRVIKDLQKMIEKGFFGGKAYLNMELGYFFRSVQADATWEQKQKENEQKAPKEAEEGYSGILRNIRRANDQIADPILTEKISRLEDVTAKIFRAVEEDPKKRHRIDTFLNYYLPTTQKLLDSYAEFEATGIEGENLGEAKARIRKTMDSIIAGFEHQLDELYKNDVMDVDSDIKVMETMLNRDTASVERDFGLKSNSGSAPAAATPPPPAAPKTTDVDLGGTAAQELKKPE